MLGRGGRVHHEDADLLLLGFHLQLENPANRQWTKEAISAQTLRDTTHQARQSDQNCTFLMIVRRPMSS